MPRKQGQRDTTAQLTKQRQRKRHNSIIVFHKSSPSFFSEVQFIGKSMSRQIVLRSTPTIRKQPLLHNQSSSRNSSSTTSLAEVVGGTTAECAAVCCCCPCGLVNLLVLAIYKVPAGLCRRALQKKRRKKLIKQGLLPLRQRRNCRCGCDDTKMELHSVVSTVDVNTEESEKAAAELEKQMWDKFYGTGFWRSPSQREEEST